MKFGIREVCNLTYRAKTSVKIGNTTFKAGQPVLIIDSAKTSTLEGAATTVYATGGRGNTRLIAWEGEKTLTFTVEDALISPIGLSILTGAGLIKSKKDEQNFVHVHQTIMAQADVTNGVVKLKDALGDDEICATAPIFALATDSDGGLTGEIYQIKDINQKGDTRTITLEEKGYGQNVIIDCYIKKAGYNVSEIQIDAENFAGYYYVEGDTYFRAQGNGKDMPAIITLPNVKIQSNFTFTMASSGDPSTFTYTMDAFPGYTYFDKTKKVLCVIQIIEETKSDKTEWKSVMPHNGGEDIITDDETNTDVDSFKKETITFSGSVDFKVDDTTDYPLKDNNTIEIPASENGTTLGLKLKSGVTGYELRDDTSIPLSSLKGDGYNNKFITTIYNTETKTGTAYTWYVKKLSE